MSKKFSKEIEDHIISTSIFVLSKYYVSDTLYRLVDGNIAPIDDEEIPMDLHKHMLNLIMEDIPGEDGIENFGVV